MPASCAEAERASGPAAGARLVDVVVQQRTARVDRLLTYLVPDGMTPGVGDVVRVPLGPREAYAYVVAARTGEPPPRARPVASRPDAAPAFDAETLALARWIAERYCCSLGEALATVVHAAAVPRTADRFVVDRPPEPGADSAVPPRLARLIAEDLAEGFTLEAVLRHPEARRAGDRATLTAALAALVRAGSLRRERRAFAPRVATARERVLRATGGEATGPRVRALVARVAAAGTLRRRDALLEGFGTAIVARAVRSGALEETLEAARRDRARDRDAAHDFEPTREQAAAIARIVATFGRGYAELLVQGVTGSGKTLVYIRAIAAVIARGGRAIVLVPEIALTPQTARRFESVFGERVAVLHSGLSERERFESRAAAARGDVDVVVGARSAVFAPLPGATLVVVDEAHERSYKQDGVPRYDAVAVARERMRRAGGTLVLGSATPPLEAYAAALRGEIAHVRLRLRATAQPLPAVTVVDLAAEFARGNRRIFSSALVDALGARLERGEKTVLFVNRRGSAGFVLCRACGSVPECARCTISLTVHGGEGLLRCHLCDAQRPVPQACPACGGGPLREFAAGTQKVADAVAALFPAARVVRMDADTTTRVGDHARLLERFGSAGDVLVGTQMVAKGLDFPDVTLVGVVAADIGLHAPDFRAAERTFDLVTQVAGRSGRARAGEAIVQTYSPDHPAVAFAASHDFDGFAAGELAQRAALRYPPFVELIYLAAIGRDRAATLAAASAWGELAAGVAGVEVLGPAPAPVARVADEWRYRLALKCDDAAAARRYLRETLRPLAAATPGVRLAIDVDP